MKWIYVQIILEFKGFFIGHAVEYCFFSHNGITMKLDKYILIWFLDKISNRLHHISG